MLPFITQTPAGQKLLELRRKDNGAQLTPEELIQIIKQPSGCHCVQRYMTHHCSNATERPIFLLFLVIIADLETEFKLLECSASTQSFSSEALDTCKNFALTGASVPLPSITATNGPLRQTVASKVENICAEQSRKVASASTRPRHASP
ncbi:sperm acrosome-associated protein 9 [Electrophorus electricus]|uniref:sperm acrosome-associated protein 9 n=1 Tax=Electrophorus electricus TaxID=8005 RepID=UPI0015D072D9|nr:sperm acrosome-associated protein 9 [Electrophorus electricus]